MVIVPKKRIELQSLLFCKDERAVRLLNSLLTELSIKVDLCHDLRSAQEKLWSQKFDGVFADCDLKEAPELLQSIRQSKHNKRSIAFALIEQETRLRTAFDSGAHFVLHKPLGVEKSKRTLRAAHGLMMREQRSHYRHVTATPLWMRATGGPEFRGQLHDLSHGGALIESQLVLSRGQFVHLRFSLPDTTREIGAEAEVCWCDPMGRSGLRFDALLEHSTDALTNWVKQRSVEPRLLELTKMAIGGDARETIDGFAAQPETTGVLGSDNGLEVELMKPVGDAPPATVEVQARSLLRGTHHAPIKVLTFRNGRPVVVLGVCENITEIGLGGELEDDLLVGDPVLIDVQLPGWGQPLVVHGEIKHRHGRHYGFEFLAVPKRAAN